MPSEPLVIAVCGGREFGLVPRGCPPDQREAYRKQAHREQFILRETLDEILRDYPNLKMIEGGANGADFFARQWFKHRLGKDPITVRANWAEYGKGAGPKRNQKIIDRYRPHWLVAFPGGTGTADMVRRARMADIHVREISVTPEFIP